MWTIHEISFRTFSSFRQELAKKSFQLILDRQKTQGIIYCGDDPHHSKVSQVPGEMVGIPNHIVCFFVSAFVYLGIQAKHDFFLQIWLRT